MALAPSRLEALFEQAMTAIAQQAQASAKLADRMGTASSSDQMALLTGSSGEEPGLTKIPGARGAAVHEIYRRDFKSHPGLFASKVRANIRKARGVTPATDQPKIDSAHDFFIDNVPCGTAGGT